MKIVIFIHWLARLEPNVFGHGKFISGISYVKFWGSPTGKWELQLCDRNGSL